MADKRGITPPPGAASAALDFAGKVVFITGAAAGQGREVALEFARAGADVVALDVGQRVEYPAIQIHESDALLSLKQEVEALGRRIVLGVADVRDDEAVGRVVDEAIAAFGRIDILFNNAGVLGYAEIDSISDEALNATIDINLKGPMIVARRVVPYMKAARSGVIINNSSIMGLRGGARLSHYVASKWGLTGLTKSWAIELAPFNIRVVSIHPTGVNTPMNDSLAAMEGSTAEEIAERSAGNLLPVPWVETEDVAALVLWLASDKARYVTGAQYALDAGLLSG
ncbi:MAG: SDR family oxidoreductase [Coriobacteriales bacterium]|jgi:NAD(P)-dependent dehydrogenase (short-subunit alcohol dehydrogenase family)|nr:SDR family oxidoreductase [Coriobacteriales bacterium]